MERVNFWFRKSYRKTIQQVCSRFYINPDRDLHKSIMVAGTARSGTTWLGDLIASQLPSRILFEPFNPIKVQEYKAFSYFQYMQPGIENSAFYRFAEKVFTGEIRDRWIDHQNERIYSEYRIIKEIRANLALKWLHEKFAMVPIVFLIRHPCAVVSSRMNLDWATDGDMEPFLSQPDLVDDYLSPFMHLIRNAKTDEEKHAIIWCISHLVPLKQLKPGEVKIVYYEDLCIQPEIELSEIFDFIGKQQNKPYSGRVDRPSTTTRMNSAVITGKNKIARWKSELRPSQSEKILKIVDAFDLGYLYEDSLLPLHENAI